MPRTNEAGVIVALGTDSAQNRQELDCGVPAVWDTTESDSGCMAKVCEEYWEGEEGQHPTSTIKTILKGYEEENRYG